MDLRSVAVAGALLSSFSMPAWAQLNVWGMWGEPPERHRTPPSNLGLAPHAKPGSTPQLRSLALLQGGARPNIAARAPKTIKFPNGFEPGSIIIDTAGRKLYYTLSPTSAYVYPVAVGRQGFTWTGVERVSRIVDWPDWHPPADMRRRQPDLPVRMTGGVRNPLGAKAIYLGDTLYRIHGTNDPRTIGSASSSGCIRMHNGHVVHLASLVGPGTTVYVMKRMPKGTTIMPPAQYKPQPAAPVEASAPGPESEPEASDQRVPEDPAEQDAPANAPAPPSDQAV